MLAFYNVLLVPVRALASLVARVGGHDRSREWDERLARKLPSRYPGSVWIHGASVGEARLAEALASRLRVSIPDRPLVVSVNTRTGRRILTDRPGIAASFYLPLDFRGLPGRVLDAVRPAALVLIETELWPNLIHETAARGVPIVIANGRLSPRRMGRYRRFSGLYRPVLERVERVGVQSEEDARRFRDLGIAADRVVRTGNLKFDLTPPDVDREAIRRRFGIEPGRPVLAAGSTGAGEDPLVLEAFAAVRRDHPEAFLVLAPRHLDRVDAAIQEAARRGWATHRLSSGDDPACGSHDLLVVDTIGELARLYGLADAAFVGGSLVPVGGHNMLEPVAVATPVLFGPHTEHFQEIADGLLQADAAIRVRTAEQLGRDWSRLVAVSADARRLAANATAVLRSNRGALDRTVDLISAVLDPRVGEARR